MKTHQIHVSQEILNFLNRRNYKIVKCSICETFVSIREALYGIYTDESKTQKTYNPICENCADNYTYESDGENVLNNGVVPWVKTCLGIGKYAQGE